MQMVHKHTAGLTVAPLQPITKSVTATINLLDTTMLQHFPINSVAVHSVARRPEPVGPPKMPHLTRKIV